MRDETIATKPGPDRYLSIPFFPYIQSSGGYGSLTMPVGPWGGVEWGWGWVGHVGLAPLNSFLLSLILETLFAGHRELQSVRLTTCSLLGRWSSQCPWRRRREITRVDDEIPSCTSSLSVLLPRKGIRKGKGEKNLATGPKKTKKRRVNDRKGFKAPISPWYYYKIRQEPADAGSWDSQSSSSETSPCPPPRCLPGID